jgi:hypothetical protein
MIVSYALPDDADVHGHDARGESITGARLLDLSKGTV